MWQMEKKMFDSNEFTNLMGCLFRIWSRIVLIIPYFIGLSFNQSFNSSNYHTQQNIHRPNKLYQFTHFSTCQKKKEWCSPLSNARNVLNSNWTDSLVDWHREKKKRCNHSTWIPIVCGYFWQLFRFQCSCEQRASCFLVATNVCALLHT